VEEYGKAIQLLNKELASPGEETPLETLATSCLLGIYELQTTPYLTVGGSWTAHINGSVAILNRNYSTKRITNDVGGLFQTILSQTLINRISSRTRPTIPLELCDTFISNSPLPAMLYRLMYKTAELLADWEDARNEKEEEELLTFSRQHVQDSQALDAEFDAWIKSRPVAWDVQKLDNCDRVVPKWLRELYSFTGAPSTLYMYSSFHVAHRWAMWRATRLPIIEAMLEAVDLQLSKAITAEERDECLTLQQRLDVQLYDLVEGIAEGLFATFTVHIPGKPDPTSLSDVLSLRGFTLLWPAFRAGITLRRDSLRRVDIRGRFGWLRSVLELLNTDLSLAKAKAFVDTFDGLYDGTLVVP
jgi:hypothetical protein